MKDGEENPKDSEGYIYLNKDYILKFFKIKGSKLYLKQSHAKPITINIPFKLDENIARIAGMMLDGSLCKNNQSIIFSQKKDKNKVREFANIIQDLFDLKPKFREYNCTPTVIFSSKTLGIFFNKCLNLSKSDEKGKVPNWIWLSPKSVIIEYLRYAFAMEGSVINPIIGCEIRFHNTDINYLEDLRNILKIKFDINSKIFKYYIKGYGLKYYLYFIKKEEILKFKEIGFALGSHQKRLEDAVTYFKNKAWEITLVNLLKLNKKIFTIYEVNKLFPYLCRRAIHDRLRSLVKMEYLKRDKIKYFLTDEGYKTALILRDTVKITKLRTNPKRNEEKIFEFLRLNNESYRNEIARKLKLNPITARDALRRLIKKNKIQYTRKDRFQKKFYKIKEGTRLPFF